MDEKQIAALREVFEAAYVQHMNSQEIASTWGQRDYTVEEIAAMREGNFYNVGVAGVGQHHGYLNGCWWGFLACYQRLAQWQPIETAPKDGTVILLGRPAIEDCDAISVPGFWREGWEDSIDDMGCDSGFVDVNFQQFSGGRSFGAKASQYAPNQPTHWMPLPAAPAALYQQKEKQQ